MTVPLKALTALAALTLVAAKATHSELPAHANPPSERLCAGTCAVVVENGFSIPLQVKYYEGPTLRRLGRVAAGAEVRLAVPVARAREIVVVGSNAGGSRVATRVVSLQPGEAVPIALGLRPKSY